MPIHDWTRVDSGLFHAFHQGWTVAIQNALNGGVLPEDYYALVEQRIAGPIADVLTLRGPPSVGPKSPRGDRDGGGLAVAEAPPRADVTRRVDAEVYATRANRVTVRHRHGEVVAVVEVVSPGNKASRSEFRTLVEKAADLIQQGVHLLVIDLFPPGPRDPLGVHAAIWDEVAGDELAYPPGRDRAVASYDAGAADRTAYLNFVAVGDPLPDAPLFLRPGVYVPAPLESSYRATWDQFPVALRGLLGSAPNAS
jgi:hypothetical protein